MLKKIIFCLVFYFTSFAVFAQETACSDDYSSLVISERSGAILYERRSDKISYPASLVKMMTLYLTFDALKHHHLTLDKVLTVSEYGEEIAKVNNANTLHLKAGDKITVEKAIEAVVVKSFNEAAVTLAEAVSGGEWEFVRKMNQKALDLGMISTSFRNASGLHEEGQYTNSYDLARLAIALKKDFPEYYHFFGQKSFTYFGQKYESHNHVLLEYKGAEGMKTGFTKASGFNLVSAAKKNDSRVISIVLGCSTWQSRDKLTKKLLDICFQKLHEQQDPRFYNKLNLKGFDYCEKDETSQDHQEIESSAIEEKLDKEVLPIELKNTLPESKKTSEKKITKGKMILKKPQSDAKTSKPKMVLKTDSHKSAKPAKSSKDKAETPVKKKEKYKLKKADH